MDRILSVLIVICAVSTIYAVPCPFNNSTCQCSGNDPNAAVFYNATCTSSTFTTPIYTYDITNQLTIIDYNAPPSLQYSTFKSIDTLVHTSSTFNNTFTPDQYAFFGTRINKFSLINYANIFPIFEAIKVLGRSGLKELNFNTAGSLNLDQDYFQDFKSLESLIIDSTPITGISDNAFASLQSLTKLAMTKASFTSFPSKALDSLRNVKEIDLSNNAITVIQDNAVRNLKSLESLHLTGTSIETFDLSVLNGAYALKNVYLDRSDFLDSISAKLDYRVPLSIEYISVIWSSIEFVDKSIQTILDRPGFKRLDLSNNANSIICDNTLAWLAPYVLCDPVRVYVDNATCQNSPVQVRDFLKSLTPFACGTTTA